MNDSSSASSEDVVLLVVVVVLFVGVDFVHEGVVLVVDVFVCVDGDVVEVDSEQYFLLHDVFGGVVR